MRGDGHPSSRIRVCRAGHACAARGPPDDAWCAFSAGASAHIFVGIKLSGGDAEKQDIIAMLEANGLKVTDLTDNEVAKLHVRHMVGGRAAGIAHEMVFRFQFPERPGALLKFLEGLNDAWNITLFHYRNHGADYGRVLVGIEVPPETRDDLFVHIDAIGFPFWDETENPAYRQFLNLQ